jgi:hypothetical protein
MRLPLDKAENVLRLLLEGMSVRSTERVTGVHRDWILRLLVLAGERCQKLMDEKLKGIDVADMERDGPRAMARKGNPPAGRKPGKNV